jgi:hypothetical protein
VKKKKKMNSNKVALMLIAVVAVGIFALPSTMSLFAGQHVWYHLNESGNQVPCEKCHAEIFEELALSNFHIGWGGAGYGNDTTADREDCHACHRTDARITYGEGGFADGNGTVGIQAHAASVVACMMCHEYNASTRTSEYGPFAGGFNISAWYPTPAFNYSNATHQGTYEAHNAFVARAIGNNTLQDSNEACVTCHTHAAVKIHWTHRRVLEFDVDIGDPMTTPEGPHNWTISDWNVSGTANAYSYGNTTGTGNTSDWGGWPGNVSDIYTYS